MPHTHSLKIKNALNLMRPIHASSASKPQAVKAGLPFTSLPKMRCKDCVHYQKTESTLEIILENISLHLC